MDKGQNQYIIVLLSTVVKCEKRKYTTYMENMALLLERHAKNVLH
jgi:hypothetical protein